MYDSPTVNWSMLNTLIIVTQKITLNEHSPPSYKLFFWTISNDKVSMYGDSAVKLIYGMLNTFDIVYYYSENHKVGD